MSAFPESDSLNYDAIAPILHTQDLIRTTRRCNSKRTKNNAERIIKGNIMIIDEKTQRIITRS
jgi:hypothetical protein